MAMRPIGILGRIFLARMLTPNDFGAVALALLFVGSSYLFVGLQMEPTVIHSDMERHKLAFHAFMITAVSSVTITLFSFANSEWLAALLGDPTIEPILQVLLLNLLLNGWTMVPAALLKKDLKFGSIATSNMVSRVSYLIVSLTLAFFGFGVWSLVIANVTQSFIALVVTWWLSPNWDWLKPVPWDWAAFKSLMSYGLRATGAGLFRFFAWNWDDWLVGRQLGTSALGFYSKAFDFTNNTMKQFGNSIVGGVFFPAYAGIKHHTQRLKRTYLKSVQLISTLMFPIGLGFLATAAVLIPVVLGEKWIPMIETFQVFSILVLTRPVSANTTSIFRAVGKPQNNMYASGVLIAVMVPAALLLLQYGIVGVAVAVLLADITGLMFNLFQVNRIFPGSILPTLRASLPALAAALLMFLIVVLSLNFLVGEYGENLFTLGAAVVIGVVIYLAGIMLFQRDFTMDVVRTAVKALDRKGRLDRFKPKRNSA